MQLSDWIKQKNVTQAEFAGMVGVKQPMISQIINGERSPSLELTLKIEKATRGQVTLKDWVALKAKAASPQRMAAE